MKETPRHVVAYEFYRDMVKRSIAKVAIEFSVSETSVNKWNKAFKWQRRIAAWDVAIREGVEEGAIEAVVETRINELEQIDRMTAEFDRMKLVVFGALESCTKIDPKTGEMRPTITPGNVQDMAALYNAVSRFNATQIKMIEVARKIRGESDNVNLKTVLEVRYEDLKEGNGSND